MDYRQFLHLKTIVESWFFSSERRKPEAATRRWQKSLQGLGLAYSHPQRMFTKVPKQRSGTIDGVSYALDTVTKEPNLSSPLNHPEVAGNLTTSTLYGLLINYVAKDIVLSPKLRFSTLFRIPSTLPDCGIQNSLHKSLI